MESMNNNSKASLRYHQAVARMESEVRRAKAQVTLLKMLYKEMQEQKTKEKVQA
jgi:hypothetical protein